MIQMIRTTSLLAAVTIVSACSSSGGSGGGMKKFHSLLTPVVDVQADMAVYLNQQHPKAGGGSWNVGDPLPPSELVVPATAVGEVKFVIDGDDFTMDASMMGLPDPTTVTDPRASYTVGSQVNGDYWDIWLLSAVPNVVTIQMGKLVADPANPGNYSLHIDSRTDVDHEGNKLSVNTINSILTAWPNEPLSLYDVSLIGCDIESANGPEEPSGQHRINDAAPNSYSINWSKPDP